MGFLLLNFKISPSPIAFSIANNFQKVFADSVLVSAYLNVSFYLFYLVSFFLSFRLRYHVTVLRMRLAFLKYVRAP